MTDEPGAPGILDRLRARYPWLDRVLRAQDHYDDCDGNFYAAGLTYFTIFALFPLLMVGFGVGGFVLSRRHDLSEQIENRIRNSIPGDAGQQLIELMNSAIDSRTSVGIIGLAVAGWAGLSWMTKLREALSQLWGQRAEPPNFVHAKISDLLAMLSAFGLTLLTIALTALGDPGVMARLLRWVGVPHVSALGGVLRGLSLLLSLLVSWLLFTWVIARLPRQPVSFAGSMRAGLIAGVGFEAFKQVGSIYLRGVLASPAGVAFGPVLGLMVFGYVTARLILFATAWAATSPRNQRVVPVEPPAPALITPRAQAGDGLAAGQAVAAAVLGALGALGLAGLARRRR